MLSSSVRVYKLLFFGILLYLNYRIVKLTLKMDIVSTDVSIYTVDGLGKTLTQFKIGPGDYYLEPLVIMRHECADTIYISDSEMLSSISSSLKSGLGAKLLGAEDDFDRYFNVVSNDTFVSYAFKFMKFREVWKMKNQKKIGFRLRIERGNVK